MLTRKAAPAVSVSIAPTSQSAGPSSNAGWTFAPCTITVTGGTPTAYSWTCTDDGSSGNWGVSSGQGTATASAAVSVVAEGEFATCSFQCTVTVGGVGYTRSCSLSYERSGSPE